MLIDFHTHVYPDAIAEKGVQYIRDFYQLPAEQKGTIAHLKSIAKASGTTHVVLLGVAVKPEVVVSVNQFTASLLDSHTFGFGSIHPGLAHPEEELARCCSLGLSGIKIHPDMQGFAIDDPAMFGIYSYLSEHQIPLMVHLGDVRYEGSRPVRLARVMDAFPDLLVIGAHLGGYQRWEEALQVLCGRPNLWLDTSSSLPFISPSLAETIIHRHGAGRILFGTDYPLTDQATELQRLNRLSLNETEKAAILYQNAAKLLGIAAAESEEKL